MGFRTGLLIGALATAVVALGVAVVILAGDEDSDGGSSTTVSSDRPSQTSEPRTTDEWGAIRNPVGATEPIAFQTPSGNIGCRVQATSVRCDIFDFDWDQPPVPANCEVPSSWGHSIELDRRGSTFVCSTQPLFNPGEDSEFPALEYGDAVGVGSIACESRERALICVSKSSRGFRLSVEEVKLF